MPKSSENALGKIDRGAFESIIAPQLGAAREDVAIGPTHGVDFGVIELENRIAVVATDPISLLADLGFGRAGRLALDIVLADVAVSGIAPTHVTVSLSLPPTMTNDDLSSTWRGMAGYADEFGVAIVAGHTARYTGIDTSWVGAGTAIGLGHPTDLVRPDGARPGDILVVSTGPGAEFAGLAAHLFGDQLDIPTDDLDDARARLADIETVGDALAATAAGDVSAVHDVTEGGLVGALSEMADGAGVRFELESTAVPVMAGVRAVCDALEVDPWHVTSAGSLVVAVSPADADAVVDALEARGTSAASVGTVTAGDGVVVDGEPVEPPVEDPSWRAMARYLADGA